MVSLGPNPGKTVQEHLLRNVGPLQGHSHTLFRHTITLNYIFLDCRGELKNLEEIHVITRRTCNVHTLSCWRKLNPNPLGVRLQCWAMSHRATWWYVWLQLKVHNNVDMPTQSNTKPRVWFTPEAWNHLGKTDDLLDAVADQVSQVWQHGETSGAFFVGLRAAVMVLVHHHHAGEVHWLHVCGLWGRGREAFQLMPGCIWSTTSETRD